MANYGRKSKTNWLAVVAGVLAALLVVSIVLGLGFNLGWFDRSEEEDPDTTETFVAENVILSDGDSSGIQLLSAALYEEGKEVTEKDNSATYTITATITPATATNQSVTMSVAWADPTSTWATGKTVTDYVTITQDSTGSLTGTLACAAEFGEQVILTVALDSDSTVYATATVDYVARVTGFNFDLTTSFNYAFGDTISGTSSVTYGTGTVYGKFTNSTVYLDLIAGIDSSSIWTFMMDYGGLGQFIAEISTSDVDYADFAGIALATTADGSVDTAGKGTISSVCAVETFMDLVSTAIPNATAEHLVYFEENYLENMISEFIDDGGSTWMATFTFEYTYTYGDTVYSSGRLLDSDATEIFFLTTGLEINGTGVAINGDEFAF